MLEPRLIELLRCPITLRSLHVADQELLSKLNAAVDRGELTNRLGEAVTRELDEALVDENSEYAVPVYQGIPNLVPDELIPLAQLQQKS